MYTKRLAIGALTVFATFAVAIGYPSYFTAAQGTMEIPPSPAGGDWQVDDQAPDDVMIGPLGVARNYEITNNGPGDVQTTVCNKDGSMSEGPTILEGKKGTVGALAGGKIKGSTRASGGASGTFEPEPRGIK